LSYDRSVRRFSGQSAPQNKKTTKEQSMRALSNATVVAMLVASLGGCGGGGSDAGTSFAPTAAAPASGADTSSPLPAKPNDPGRLEAGSETGGPTVAASAAASPSLNMAAEEWSAQLVDTGAGFFGTAAVKVGGPDPRNGEYKVYSIAAKEYTLSLDFDRGTYVFRDGQGMVFADAFSRHRTEVGTYIFRSTWNRSNPSRSSRFRIKDEAIVGAFAFDFPGLPSARWDRPFIALRNFVTVPGDLDGLYNRSELITTPDAVTGMPTLSSKVRQVKIESGGTRLLACSDAYFFTRIAACPSIQTYSNAGTAAGNRWTFVNDANPNDKFVFAVARVGDEKVSVEAGPDVSAPPTSVFRIGLTEPASWSPVTAIGSDGLEGWARFDFGADTFSASGINWENKPWSVSFGYLDYSSIAPAGMRMIYPAPYGIYSVQSRRLVAMVGGAYQHYGWEGGFFQIAMIE
jgi:hypothetical protein